MQYWKKLNPEEIRKRVFTALGQNVDFRQPHVLGIPASHLDDKVFYSEAPFLKEAPYLATLLHNPNHIGCHTLGKSEHFFAGTQAIEREVIELLATDLLQAEPGTTDGYVASGGTEANTQAMWMYRNEFMREHGAELNEIAILCSADSHYSMPKAANLLQVSHYAVAVEDDTRAIKANSVAETLDRATAEGKRYFIVVANMMTTMFGSVDDPNVYTNALEERELTYRLHVDGAYGGFFYPVAATQTPLTLANPKVSSVTLDAHKMLQAPYGTGIFLTRKGLIGYTHTEEAQYVEGQDTTLIGSRSGANAVAVWMILQSYGPHGWFEKIQTLLQRTLWLTRQLDQLGVRYFHDPFANIVTMRAEDLPSNLANRYGLVPDEHDNPHWFKIVVMDHVTVDAMAPFVQELQEELAGVAN